MAGGARPRVKGGSDSSQKADQGQNIQVFARVRPINAQERAGRTYSVVETQGHKELTMRAHNHGHNRTFQFDRVFDTKSEQVQVYGSVVEPLLEQVMMGYNCTVFAYGQTGSGKTFTMEGDVPVSGEWQSWDSHPTAGVIPRCLGQIFDKLRLAEETEGAESSVRVSFLELYNEEIFDLLSSAEDMPKLRIFDDPLQPGSVIIKDLEEVTVRDKREVYSLLKKGSEKRQTAETLMNAQSSRSHTIFTVTVHVRETTREGVEVLRIGKLNLVDLAGAENVGRSGAQGNRAREASNINQSLLTLSRVISSLVEHAPHVPYRESKLTRLLQDSLGGRTKTSIIATVSPAATNYEETLCTLEYAFRARNIKNRPQANEKLEKAEVLKEYSNEAERLRRELTTIQSVNGVYLNKENWLELLGKIEENEKRFAEKSDEIIAVKMQLEIKTKMFEDIEKSMFAKSREVGKVTDKLIARESKLEHVKEVLERVTVEKEEQEYQVKNLVETEGRMTQEARQLKVVCHEVEQDKDRLHTKVEKFADIDAKNATAVESFQPTFDEAVSAVVSSVESWSSSQVEGATQLGKDLGEQLDLRKAELVELGRRVEELAMGREAGLEGLQGHLDREVVTAGREAAAAVGGAAEEGRRRMEAEGGRFLAGLAPQLEDLAARMREQAEHTRALQDTVGRDLGQLATLSARQMEVTTGRLRRVDGMVQQLHSDSKAAAGEVSQACARIGHSHDGFSEALTVLQAAHGSHDATMATELVRTLPAATGPATEAAVQEMDGSHGVVVQHKEAYGGEAERVKVATAGIMAAAVRNGEEGAVKAKEIEQEVKVFTESNKALWSEFKSDLEGTIEAGASNLEEATKAQAEKVGEEIEEVEAVAAEVAEQCAESRSRDEAGSAATVARVVGLESAAAHSREDSAAGAAALGSLVTDFLTDQLADYSPQGDTPVRTTRRYPHFLTVAEPPARVIDRFRREKERSKAGHDDSGDSGVVSAASVSRGPSTDSLATSVAVGEAEKENLTEDDSTDQKFKKPHQRKVFGSSLSVNRAGE